MEAKHKYHAAQPRPVPRRGFTLVEMLTVIVIISILAGLITAAVVPAMRRARAFTIRNEIAQLAIALEKYKTERGDYPPDFAGVGGGATNDINLSNPNDLTKLGNRERAAVLQHFRKAFPRYKPGICPGCPLLSKGNYDGLIYDINYASGSNISRDITPAAALVLMLGGPPATEDSSTKLLGFSANPANPFARGGSRLPPLYEFDETRLDIEYTAGVPTSWPVYTPPHMPQSSNGSKAPYVYFRPRNRDYGRTRSSVVGGYAYELPYFCQSLDQGICTPYAAQKTVDSSGKITRWMEPATFQIISAGLDGLFNTPITDHTNVIDEDVRFKSDDLDNVRFLSGDDANIAPEEDDNITSFTQGKLADRAEE